MPAQGDVLSRPHRIGIYAGDALGPMSDCAHRSTSLIFVDFEECAKLQFVARWQRRPIHVRGNNFADPGRLKRLDGLVGQGSPNAVPITVIHHRCGAISIEDRVDTSGKRENQLEKFAPVSTVSNRTIHDRAQRVLRCCPVALAEGPDKAFRQVRNTDWRPDIGQLWKCQLTPPYRPATLLPSASEPQKTLVTSGRSTIRQVSPGPPPLSQTSQPPNRTAEAHAKGGSIWLGSLQLLRPLRLSSSVAGPA